MQRAPFPATRLRRTRASAPLRHLVREVELSVHNLIWPIFVRDGEGIEEHITAMPGVMRWSVDKVVAAAHEAAALGIPAICLFPYTDASRKTERCEEANIDIAIMTDIALDPYNIHGHDGIVRDGVIVNDETVEALVKMGLAQAQAGADILGPSDMMDGRIGALRSALEAGGHHGVVILSYAAKFASAFYGPFRDAVGASGALKGDKKTYQIDPANCDEALACVARDLSEGADMVMVKPGLPYLDLCRMVKDRFHAPTYAYQVSGEYAMIEAAAAQGWIDGDRAMLESLTAFRRAGCDGVLTYFAPRAARLLNG